jgi:chorismate lyase / 3-hydroxybenzoate synthase
LSASLGANPDQGFGITPGAPQRQPGRGGFRWQRAAAALPPPAGAFGRLAWGAGSGVPLALLAGPATIDWLLGDATCHAGQTGPVRWWTSGDWAFGELDLPDVEQGLAEAARAAYAALFEALDACGRPHPLRLWNYLPRINVEAQGLERYRQFNIGRQQAFVDAGRPAFEGAPAACALGRPDGGLSLRFLSGRQPGLALENPRQVPAWRYSTQFGPRSPTFSRAALADAGAGGTALLVSGTAAIVGERSLHTDDLVAQVNETVANLRAVVEVANGTLATRCRSQPAATQPVAPGHFDLPSLAFTIYVRHAADAEAALVAFARALGTRPDAVVLQADICRAELLVEIEAHGLLEATWPVVS